MSQNNRQWQVIAELDDIPVRGSRRITYGEKTIALFRTTDDKVYALADQCPHEQGPLSEGIVHDGCVTCPLHNWVISLETGEAQGADQGSTASYPIKVDNQHVYICLNTAEHALTQLPPQANSGADSSTSSATL